MNRNELNKQRTIDDIKDCFIDLYEKKGIEQISVREICENVKISRTIFYKYFEDKYSVLEEIEGDLLAETKKINAHLKTQNIRAYKRGDIFPVLYETIQYIYEQKKYFRPLLSAKGDPSFIFKWKKQIRDDVRNQNTSVDLDIFTQIDNDVINELFASICIGLYTYWFFENTALTPKQIAEFESYILYVLYIKI